ncbi:MAG: hypothetical protein ACT4ON_11365 [Bacteroidota bacterium]
MTKKKTYKTKSKLSLVKEPLVSYGDKSIHVFNSFKEQEEYLRKKMAELSPKELMNKLEEMRKFFMRDQLLSNGNWPALEKKITIQEPKTKL